MQDWTGNKNSVYKTLSASSHCKEERQSEDYYATDPSAVEKLMQVEEFFKDAPIWECAVGEGHIADVLKKHGYKIVCSDIIDRGYDSTEIIDFLKYMTEGCRNDKDIITNPPYKYAREFVEHALDISMESVKIAMLLKIQFLEGKKRFELFKKYPPTTIYVFSERVECAKNGEFTGGSAVCYAWFIWEKGFKGNPIVKWI